jgi:hypothetical protein
LVNFGWIYLIKRDLKIKIVLSTMGVLALLAFLLFKSPSMPSYNPERDYLDMEIPYTRGIHYSPRQ